LRKNFALLAVKEKDNRRRDNRLKKGQSSKGTKVRG
jgi:hypothetical protein